MITQLPTLFHPNYECPFTFNVTYQTSALVGVFFQENMVDGYFSKKFDAAQKNYPIIEKKGIVTHLSLQHFRPLIYGAKIIVDTDQRHLLYNK